MTLSTRVIWLQAHRRAWPQVAVEHWLQHMPPPWWVWWTPDGWGYVAWGAVEEARAEGPTRYEAIRAVVERTAWAWAHDAADAPSQTTPRWFGGFAFDPRPRPSRGWWRAFGHARFVLPRGMYVQSPTGQAWVVRLTRDAEEPVWPTRRAAESAYDNGIWPRLVARHEGLTWPQWRVLMRHALRALRSGALSKVVLARTRELVWQAALPWGRLWQRLSQAYPRTYRFLYRPGPEPVAFVGASPELLVRVQGETLETMALAGSIGRGRTPEEDTALAAELLASAKDRAEHAWVVQAVQEALLPLTEALEMPPAPRVRVYAHIQHLYTPIRGRLAAARVWEVVARLHPTPALGGYPREAALAFIAAHEPMPRGWYAAPVGWVTPQGDGEFAGAIRSAVVREGRALLYAGAGIVADSDPRREWEEIDLKFNAMQRVLVAGEMLPPN